MELDEGKGLLLFFLTRWLARVLSPRNLANCKQKSQGRKLAEKRGRARTLGGRHVHTLGLDVAQQQQRGERARVGVGDGGGPAARLGGVVRQDEDAAEALGLELLQPLAVHQVAVQLQGAAAQVSSGGTCC